ncbi:MAG: homocysteine S-methyltransferase family protein, partial [Actinomycetota bacterium]
MDKLEEGISFLDAINKRLLICDGAMGTMLQNMGISQCPDTLNANDQKIEKVVEVHLGYLQAGSDIIQTNTFGSNPVKLKSCSLENKVELVNSNAVSAAKKAIQQYRSNKNSRKVFIAGDVGPLGVLLEPSGNISYSQAVNFFTQQIEVLADSGVDIILIETIMDINEAYAAVEAAKKSTGLPIICTLTFGSNGVTMMGNRAEDAVKLLQDKGADIVGANCSLG